MKDNILVVGGGIAGLVSAYLLSQKNLYNIYVIEKSDTLGGLLKSFDYGKYGKFDYGAHNFLETGIKDLDDLIKGLLNENDWQVSSAINSQKRALTGIYFNNKLQKDSPFVDLQNNKNIDSFKLNFIETFESNKNISYTTAYKYAKSLFGKEITKKIIIPIFKNLYNMHPKDMDYMAMYLTPLTRVGLFNEKIMKDLLPTKKLSKVLAYPKQQNLDHTILGTKKAYYPKKYGIYRVINALKEKLQSLNVTILLENQVKEIKLKSNKISSIQLNDQKISNIKQLFWSAGHNQLANLLDIKIDTSKYQVPKKTVIINVLLNKKLKIGKLCYFYNYDKKYKTFRVDNYINYCDGAKRKGLYPISIEMLLEEEELKDIDKISDLALKELSGFDILAKGTQIKFVKTEVLNYGFPLLSKTNIQITDQIRKKIKDKDIENLTTIGILSNKDLFFESDIKKDLYLKIKEFKNDN